MVSPRQTVIILDFGAQYTQLIARRVREQHVYSEIVPHSLTSDEVEKIGPAAIVLSGGPSSVYRNEAPMFDERILELGIPVLGICYGLQLLIHHFGGKVHSNGQREYGCATIHFNARSELFNGISDNSQVWMSHGDTVTEVPEGWEVTALSSNNIIAAVQERGSRLFGTQFHPEVEQTKEGKKILANFLFNVAHCAPDWTTGSLIDRAVRKIQSQVGQKKVLCAVSGGVDSAVVARLIRTAVGDQLRAVFVDHGLLRKNERSYVTETLQAGLDIPIEYHDHSEAFLKRLQGITDPERKRSIVGEEFIRCFEKISQTDGGIDFLAQGTLYPDVIESGAVVGLASTIKSHHNVGGLPQSMNFQLVEPLRELFKDEVRQVGRELGIPQQILGRHPFPGPGLAVRIVGEVTPSRLQILREADDIYICSLKEGGIYDEIWQAFCVLVPIKTVGVMGDQRTYENLIALRAVTSLDGMTADWYKMPYEVINAISARIVNSVNGVNRVVYDVSSKPPSTIEWE